MRSGAFFMLGKKRLVNKTLGLLPLDKVVTSSSGAARVAMM